MQALHWGGVLCIIEVSSKPTWPPTHRHCARPFLVLKGEPLQLLLELFQILPHSYFFFQNTPNTGPLPFIIYDGLEKTFYTELDSHFSAAVQCSHPPSRIFCGLIYLYNFRKHYCLQLGAHANANAVVTSVFAAVSPDTQPLKLIHVLF